jgi:pectin methylesterase-like acyl-CoA thioesterase
VISIKEGVYEETVRIPLEKKNVVFLGDGLFSNLGLVWE